MRPWLHLDVAPCAPQLVTLAVLAGAVGELARVEVDEDGQRRTLAPSWRDLRHLHVHVHVAREQRGQRQSSKGASTLVGASGNLRGARGTIRLLRALPATRLPLAILLRPIRPQLEHSSRRRVVNKGGTPR